VGQRSPRRAGFDHSRRDGLASPGVAIDMKGVADFLTRQGHRLNIVGLECAGLYERKDGTHNSTPLFMGRLLVRHRH
jgi:hypothetical protein